MQKRGSYPRMSRFVWRLPVVYIRAAGIVVVCVVHADVYFNFHGLDARLCISVYGYMYTLIRCATARVLLFSEIQPVAVFSVYWPWYGFVNFSFVRFFRMVLLIS